MCPVISGPGLFLGGVAGEGEDALAIAGFRAEFIEEAWVEKGIKPAGVDKAERVALLLARVEGDVYAGQSLFEEFKIDRLLGAGDGDELVGRDVERDGSGGRWLGRFQFTERLKSRETLTPRGSRAISASHSGGS